MLAVGAAGWRAVRCSVSLALCGCRSEPSWSTGGRATTGQKGERQADIIYSDTITVTENAQVFTVTYDYGGGSESGEGVLLPDTATRASVDAQPFGAGLLPVGIAALVGSVVVGVLLASALVRRLR